MTIINSCSCELDELNYALTASQIYRKGTHDTISTVAIAIVNFFQNL